MKLHFFHYCLNKNSHPQPEKSRFILDKNLAVQNIEISRFRCMTKIFILFGPEFCTKIIVMIIRCFEDANDHTIHKFPLSIMVLF